MIAKISRGGDTAGLLRYLLGPGRANEHTDPHLIASWDGDPATLEPDAVNGRPQVKDLARLLDQPLDALQRRPASSVWHCSLRNAPGDRRLTDQEWAQAARHVLDRVGLAPAGDDEACRWIVARHGDDHVHLLVTLARQDGVPARTSNDYRRAGRACQDLEQRFDLTSTRDRDSTAVQRPTRAETEKARRGGREESARDTLRREVRLASMAALDPGAFLNELQRSGLLVKTRYSTQDPGQLTGYAVAWPRDHAPGGTPVWFSGSTLAPDLSLPRLEDRWELIRDEVARLRSPSNGGLQRQGEWAPVFAALAGVTAAPGAVGEAARLAHAAASALTAVSRVLEGHRGGASTRASSRLMNDLDRTVPGAGPGSAGGSRLLAVAHIVVRASRSTRPGATDATHLEQALLDLLRVIARAPVPGPRPRHLSAAERVVDRPDSPARPGAPGTPSGVRAREVRRGGSGVISVDAHPEALPHVGTSRRR